MNAVDTNIFLYSLDDREPLKKIKAQQLFQRLLLSSEPVYLLWQVLGEIVNQLRRWKSLGLLSDADFANHVQLFRGRFSLVMPVPKVLDNALDLANRYSLSHWDSMILGACEEIGVATLYTEDIGSPSIIDQIQLVNPLI